MDTRQKVRKGLAQDGRFRNMDDNSSDTIIVHTDNVEDGEVVDDFTVAEDLPSTSSAVSGTAVNGTVVTEEVPANNLTPKGAKTRKTPKKQQESLINDLTLSVTSALQRFNERLDAIEAASRNVPVTSMDKARPSQQPDPVPGTSAFDLHCVEGFSRSDNNPGTLTHTSERSVSSFTQNHRTRRHTALGIPGFRQAQDPVGTNKILRSGSSGSSGVVNPTNMACRGVSPPQNLSSFRADQFGNNGSGPNVQVETSGHQKIDLQHHHDGGVDTVTAVRGIKRPYGLIEERDMTSRTLPPNIRTGRALTTARSDWITPDQEHLYSDHRPASEQHSYNEHSDISGAVRAPSDPTYRIQPDPAYASQVPDPASSDVDRFMMRPPTHLGTLGAAQPFFMCGDGVPIKIRNRIGRNEYVEMHELESALSKREGEDSSLIIDLANAQSPSVSRAPSSRQPLTFNQWSRCFHKFMTIYQQFHGKHRPLDLSLDMIAYHEVVRELWERQGRWAAFDEHFRRRKESFPCSWADKDVIFYLRLKYGTPSSHNQPTSKGQQGPSRNQRPNDSRLVPKHFCTEFHMSGKCSKPKCDYIHFCYRCRDQENPHSASVCTKYNKKVKTYPSVEFYICVIKYTSLE